MEESKAIKEAKAFVDLWAPRLGLSEWVIKVKEKHKPSPDDSDRPFATRAEVVCDPTYEEATITVFPAFDSADREEKEGVIVHELTHCLTEPQYRLNLSLMEGKLVTEDEAQRVNESTTERMAKLLIKAWKSGKK